MKPAIFVEDNHNVKPDLVLTEVYADEQCYINAFVDMDEQGVGSAEVQNIYVAEELRKKGMGTALMKAFMAEMKARGVTDIRSDTVNLVALKLRLKLFGKEALNFYEYSQPDEGAFPITAEQAVASLERAAEYDPNHPSTIGVRLNLADVDTSRWQRPIYKSSAPSPSP